MEDVYKNIEKYNIDKNPKLLILIIVNNSFWWNDCWYD